MQEGSGYTGADRRVHKRSCASGTIGVTAYFRSDEYHAPRLRDCCTSTKYYRSISGSGDLIDASLGGIRIKTSVPLKESCLIEVNNQKVQLALVQWVSRTDDHFHAGLMFL